MNTYKPFNNEIEARAAAAPFSIARHGCRIEIVMHGSSIALSDTPENESLAALIVQAVNEHAALCAVAEAANNAVMTLGNNVSGMYALDKSLAKLAAVRNEVLYKL